MMVFKKIVIKLDPANSDCFYLIPLSLEKDFDELMVNLKSDWHLYKDELNRFEKYWYQPEKVRVELIIFDEDWQEEE